MARRSTTLPAGEDLVSVPSAGALNAASSEGWGGSREHE